VYTLKIYQIFPPVSYGIWLRSDLIFTQMKISKLNGIILPMLAVSTLILPLIHDSLHYKNGLLFSFCFCKEYGNVAITNKIKLVTSRRYPCNYILVALKHVSVCCSQCLTAKWNALRGASAVYGNAVSIKRLLRHCCIINLTGR